MNDSGYYSDYDTVTSSSSMVNDGVILGVLIGFVVLTLVIYVIHAIFLGMVFKKAGVESWKAWVPVYNSWKLLEIGSQPGWWALLAFLPIVNVVAAVFMLIAMYRIGLNLQKEGWFVALAILVPTVWLIWLALDKSTWQPNGQQQPPQDFNQPPSIPPSAPPTMPQQPMM